MTDYMPPVIRAMWTEARRGAHAAAAARRARVLAKPDIAKRLCEAPLSLRAPENWSGYLPPSMWGDDRDGHGPFPNDSPYRKQLIDIMRAVVDAEQGAVQEAT